MHWKRSCACGVVMAFASLSTASATVSECISLPVDARKLLHHSALVFAGTLVEGGAAVERGQYELTFQPDRVWKGNPSNRATVYVLGTPFVGSYVFRPGQRYLVAARLLQEDERTLNGIFDPAATVFGIDRPCGSPLPLSLLPELDKVARPRTPR
jgi:hypothetical protein